MAKIILHIGLPKTATTFLQANIFPFIKEINYIGGNVYPSLVRNPLSEYILLSNEGLSGNPYKYESFFEQFKKNVLALESTFNQPYYIICFRQPAEFIESIYKQYLHEGGTISFEAFFSLKKESLLESEDFKFSQFVDFLESRILSDRLFIYDFDTFKKKPALLVFNMLNFIFDDNAYNDAKVEELMGTSKRANPSVPLQYEKILRKWNVFNTKFHKLTGINPYIKIFKKTINARVVCQYLLPKIHNSGKKRDLTEIKEFFYQDYSETRQRLTKYTFRGI